MKSVCVSVCVAVALGEQSQLSFLSTNKVSNEVDENGWTNANVATVDMGATSSVPSSQSDVPRKKVIYFHLHKYGGTTMCWLAKRHGETVPKVNNCNAPTTSGAGPVRCEARLGMEYSWTQIEHGIMEDDRNCPGAMYAVMLRHPMSAIKSFFSYYNFKSGKVPDSARLEGKKENNIRDWVSLIRKPVISNDTLERTAGIQAPSSLRPMDTFYHMDNFAVRTLSGNYWNRSAGHVVREDLEAAKAVLKQLDAVLILEELGEHAPQLHKVFGWDISSDDPTLNPKPSNKKKTHETDDWTNDPELPEIMKFLEETNSLDLELYEYAKELGANLTKQAQKA